MCRLRQLRDTWSRHLDLVCIGADARRRNMHGPGSRKQSKQGLNTEHTEKKLKPQVTQRKNIGNARWIRRTSRHSMNSLCETRWLELLLCGLCVKALLCDAANPPAVEGQPIRPDRTRRSNAIALTKSANLPRLIGRHALSVALRGSRSASVLKASFVATRHDVALLSQAPLHTLRQDRPRRMLQPGGRRPPQLPDPLRPRLAGCAAISCVAIRDDCETRSAPPGSTAGPGGSRSAPARSASAVSHAGSGGLTPQQTRRS